MSKPSDVLPASPTPTAGEGEVNLLEYWRILIERRKLALTCLGATVLVVMLFSFLSTPIFRATTTLQIERQGPDILTFKDVVGTDPALAAYQDYYQTQYKILQSRTVLRIAAERLDLDNRPEFLPGKKSPARRAVQWVRSLVSGGDAPETGADPHDASIDFIAANLSISPIRKSHLVEVSFMNRDPALARDVANAVSYAYQQFNLEARYSTTEEASEFLTKEVVRLQSEISELERELQAYSSQKEILTVSDGRQDISEQGLADSNARLTDARSRMALEQARFDAVREAPPASLPEVLKSPLISHLKQQYAEVERRHSQMAERFKPGWPALTEVREELEQLQRRLAIETDEIAHQVREVARTSYSQAQAEVAYLERQVEDHKLEVGRMSLDSIEYGSLKSEIDTRRRVLSDLVTRQSETETSGQLRNTGASNIRVVDRAELPEEPARPRKLLNLILSLFLGSVLGVGVAFTMHYLDNTIKSEQEVQRYTDLAVLGHIPLFQPLRVVAEDGENRDSSGGNLDLVSHVDPHSGFAEAFRNLRTSLLLASPDHPPRHITVTSCEPGDGKSTVALNLAVVLTQMGRRVLLVDGDLRRPRLHKVLRLSNDVGLSSFLSGNVAPDELFQELDVRNLQVITSGPVPPNPSELLDSPGLNSLLERLEKEEQYDHVIFDSPPALQVADGVILAAKMDATILVVRAGMTSRESLGQGVVRLRQSRARVIGTVLNAVSERARYYYYRRYGYYSRYGKDSQSDSSSNAARKRRGIRRRAKQA